MNTNTTNPPVPKAADQSAVPSGYRRTEVGVIPYDWEVKPLGQCLSRPPRYGINAAAVPFDEALHTYVRITDISEDGRFVPAPKVSVAHPHANGYLLDDGDLVFARTGASVGKSYCYEPNDGALVFAGFLIQITPNANQLRPGFLKQYVQTGAYWDWVATMSARSGQPGINGKEYGTLLLPLPPTTEEQDAIAEALSDVDGLIEALEKLIAKKRAIKQAAIQQLITGNTRLPGFSSQWEPTTLGELATFLSGGTPSRSNDEFWNGDIPWISATSLRCFEICRSDSNVTEEAVAAGSKMAPVGSTLMLVRGSALHKEILCGLVTKPVCFNQDVKALVPHPRVVPIFLTTVIRGRAEDFLKLVSSAGNTAGVLDTKLLKAFEINLPSSDEQAAIAQVLSDMDAEIESLERRRDKTQKIKQGMMQQLLTGRVRLVDAEATI